MHIVHFHNISLNVAVQVVVMDGSQCGQHNIGALSSADAPTASAQIAFISVTGWSERRPLLGNRLRCECGNPRSFRVRDGF